jgi:hypothetical protein
VGYKEADDSSTQKIPFRGMNFGGLHAYARPIPGPLQGVLQVLMGGCHINICINWFDENGELNNDPAGAVGSTGESSLFHEIAHCAGAGEEDAYKLANIFFGDWIPPGFAGGDGVW